MTTETILIGVWCLAAATVLGWLLHRLDKWSEQSIDSHVDEALALANARGRHPATRAPQLTPPPPPAVCPTCHAPIAYGPTVEHICGGGPR